MIWGHDRSTELLVQGSILLLIVGVYIIYRFIKHRKK